MCPGVSELLRRVKSGSIVYHANRLRLKPLRRVVLSEYSGKSDGTLEIIQEVG